MANGKCESFAQLECEPRLSLDVREDDDVPSPKSVLYSSRNLLSSAVQPDVRSPG
jgi:hypothetical protein